MCFFNSADKAYLEKTKPIPTLKKEVAVTTHFKN
jgi:hypothetical protein